jgi:glucose/arabinose dehydrogenase
LLLLLAACQLTSAPEVPVAAPSRAAPAAAPDTCWPGDGPPEVCLAPVWPAAGLNRALWFGAPPKPDGFHYVLLQEGRILALGEQNQLPQQVSDLTDRVKKKKGNEEGLLGMAFHPNYPDDPRIFVYYTAEDYPARTSVLSEFPVKQLAPAIPDRTKERVLMEIPQPYGNHNGGALAFGPDGRLYLGLGDGGSGGDPEGNGQNTETWLGSILRIDVDGAPAEGLQYAIPPDNPFASGQGGRPEIYAWGLRNPWRMSFDPVTGALWVGDVGQNLYEEIDRVERGGNYGWNIREGEHCFSATFGCADEGLVAPVWEYDHDDGVSVTGGVVYRGSAIPGLAGAYLFGDFARGRVWGLCEQGGDVEVEELFQAPAGLSHFGVGADGEVYLVQLKGQSQGGIFKLAPAGTQGCLTE